MVSEKNQSILFAFLGVLGQFFRMGIKQEGVTICIVTPSFSRIRTNGLEPSRCYSLEPETSASTNSATCALECVRGYLTTFRRTLQAKFCKKCKKVKKSAKKVIFGILNFEFLILEVQDSVRSAHI